MTHARVICLATLALVAAVACSDAAPSAVVLEPALGGVTFTRPVEVGAYPGERVFVAERGGAIWVVTEEGSREQLADLSPLVEAERGEGLLSVALDPGFASNGWLWAYYFAHDEPWRTALARFEVRADTVDLASEVVVLDFGQPGFNQNGGAIRFDAEGYLYLSLGDGSASTDPFEQGQDLTTTLATVIRIDVYDVDPRAEQPYAIPEDNPFVGDPLARPEIYAYGFRNPWRMSLDAETGDLWLGDVGFSFAEEVNRVEAGGNYGWSILEGARCLSEADCPTEGLTPPVHAYPHEGGRCAVVGGVVYRGDALPGLRGDYLFGDLCTGEIWSLPASLPIEGDDVQPAPLARLEGMLVTFGVDADGEVLVADYQGGGVYRLVEDE